MHSLYQSYKQQPVIQDFYDAICIGSGLGSLTTASLLARKGWKVLVLEKHTTPGGFTHVFKRNKYEWDVGLHYVGDMHRKGSMARLVFEHITDGNLKWADMGEVYDHVIIGDKSYEYVKGLQNWKTKMKSYFPTDNDARAIDKYVELLFAVNKSSKSFFMQKALPDFIRFLTNPFLGNDYKKFASKTTQQTLDEISDNDELKAVLSAQFGDYGMPPDESSFVIHAAVALHYMNGGYYPIGGSEEIFNTIAPSILENGGAIIVGADVQEIETANGIATGVKMRDGKTIKSKLVISGAGVHTTFNHLISATDKQKIKYDQDVKYLPHSSGHLSLYIGLKETAADLKLPKANYWIYPNGNLHNIAVKDFLENYKKEFPVVYISFPSAKNPKFEEKYPGRATIEIITVAKYEWFQKWENEKWKKRGEEYDRLKENFAQRLLEHLYRVEPQLRGKIDYYELSTPITTRHFCNYGKGEIYGLDHGTIRFEKDYLQPKTPIKNFYLTGQDIVTVGIAGALMSGVLTASAILKTNLISDMVKQAKGL
ncbi:MAG TPA: NAD(P)/FAD-dependent oxidoreductase [Chitinophagales bacterium]|nr:NAD(P)/FAD-dependent oxidoreductase [Chitinophagales bacterium]HNL84969.1 NAD(P)/FAD-dependent oxidoreductase [Chitinophagales bacterium]